MTILSGSNQAMTFDTFLKTAPGVVNALSLLGKAIDDSGLEKQLSELIKLRASQLNGCAFCLQYHLNLARKLGLEAVKIDLVATWRDAGVFTSRERSALAWTEALTNMANHPVPDSIYTDLQDDFTVSEINFLTAAIAAINAWNRIAGALKFAPPLE